MSGAHQNQGNLMMDICDGCLFANHPVFQRNEKALQIIGYYNEVTLTNPMGSSAKEHYVWILLQYFLHVKVILYIVYVYNVSAVYFSLGNIDPALRSRLDCINLVALFQADLLERYSIDAVLEPFISDLKKLSAVSILHLVIHYCQINANNTLYLKPGGCTMTIQESSHSIKGTLIAFIGDTPAVNMAGGFKEGVGGVMRKCRHCLAINSMIQSKVRYKLLKYAVINL